MYRLGMTMTPINLFTQGTILPVGSAPALRPADAGANGAVALRSAIVVGLQAAAQWRDRDASHVITGSVPAGFGRNGAGFGYRAGFGIGLTDDRPASQTEVLGIAAYKRKQSNDRTASHAGAWTPRMM